MYLFPLGLPGVLEAHHIVSDAQAVEAILGRPNLDGILAINEEAWQLFAKFLVYARCSVHVRAFSCERE